MPKPKIVPTAVPTTSTGRDETKDPIPHVENKSQKLSYDQYLERLANKARILKHKDKLGTAADYIKYEDENEEIVQRYLESMVALKKASNGKGPENEDYLRLKYYESITGEEEPFAMAQELADKYKKFKDMHTTDETIAMAWPTAQKNTMSILKARKSAKNDEDRAKV